MPMLSRVTAFLLAGFLALTVWAAEAAELIMIEEDGCVWCARWDREIGPIYPLSAEGKAAPLRRINIRAGQPPGITFKSPVAFTPTFILIDNGAELGRIEGYPGEDFFWGLLGQLFQQLPPAIQSEVTTL
jgi:hypothetical protein